MKILTLLTSILLSIGLFSQEPIYNINKYNFHQFDNALYNPYLKASFGFDSRMEFYPERNTFSNRNYSLNHLFFEYNIDRSLIIGSDIDYRFTDSKHQLDALSLYVKSVFALTITSYLYGKIGVRHQEMYYSIGKEYNQLYQFGKDPINIATVHYSLNAALAYLYENRKFAHSVNVSAKHLNTPNLPSYPEDMPIQYDFLIRSIWDKRFTSTLRGRYQNSYLADEDGINQLMNLGYVGFGLDYNFNDSITVGLSWNFLLNRSDIAGVYLTYNFGVFSLSYSCSYFISDQTQNLYDGSFHQLGMYYRVPSRRIVGRVGIGCPSF